LSETDDTLLDAAFERFERARDLRDAGNDEEALELIAAALEEIERVQSEDAAIARAQFTITRAEIATRTKAIDEAIALATEAVARARAVRRIEPRLEPSALYMLGKAERPSRERRFGMASFESSLALWRRLEGEDSRFTLDAANSLVVAAMKNASWQHAYGALDLLIEQEVEPRHYLNRAIVRERLGLLEEASQDLERWRASAESRPAEERVRGELAFSRLAATGGNLRAASAALARARKLVVTLPEDPVRTADLLEASAWIYAVITDPPWLLASEVLMRRAAALAWSPALADTAWRIAAVWRYGVSEEIVQPAFAVLDIEASLQAWDPASAVYVARPKHQQLQLVVAGAPTSIERLADERWRDLAIQRLFSTFHAEQFTPHDTNFVACVKSRSLLLPPAQVLELLPALRIPKWSTTATVAISSLGEVEALSVAEVALLATRAQPHADALVAVQRALPSLGKEVAREMLAAPKKTVLSPTVAIPMFPEA
jgi:tetratricopeptide (TPR) repeat protein